MELTYIVLTSLRLPDNSSIFNCIETMAKTNTCLHFYAFRLDIVNITATVTSLIEYVL